MSENKKQHEEEVDLGSLFIIIGKGFNKVIGFFVDLFKNIFHVIILLLLFLKKHTIKLILSLVLGSIIGFFIEDSKIESYTSWMVIQPNFGSSSLIYNNIQFYNDLVEQKDTLLLSEIFKISYSEASSLGSFQIEPIVSEDDIINKYEELSREIDTTTLKNYPYEDFKKSFTDLDYSRHLIEVKATDKKIFYKLSKPILSSVYTNEYFNTAEKLNNENLKRTDSIFRNDLVKLDSLGNVFMSVLIEQSKNPNTQGTNIDLGSNKTSSKELELFEAKRVLNNRLSYNTLQTRNTSNVINVYSDFSKIGTRTKGFSNNYIFILGVGFLIMALSIILLFELNKYLENYKK